MKKDATIDVARERKTFGPAGAVAEAHAAMKNSPRNLRR